MQQRYLDTQIASGMISSQGGPESFASWSKHGPLYHFNWLKDGNDRSSQLQLSIAFGGTTGIESNANVFVCAHYTKKTDIYITNGYISEVRSLAV